MQRKTDQIESYWIKMPSFLEAEFQSMGLSIARTLNDSGQVYDDVLRVRSAIYGLREDQVYDSFDSYSDHYCAYIDGQAVGAIRATPAFAGKIDCQEYFPTAIMAPFRSVIVTVTRFCVQKSANQEMSVALNLARALCFDQIKRNGIRIGIINVHQRAIQYYRKLGYCLVCGSFFIHPRWQTPSYVMVAPVDPGPKTPFQEIYQQATRPFTLAELKTHIKLHDPLELRHPAKVTCNCPLPRIRGNGNGERMPKAV